MPTYENQTERRITFPDKNYLSWQPGESRALLFFVPHEDLGLTMTDEKPYVLKERPYQRGYGFFALDLMPNVPAVQWLPYNMTIELSVYTLKGNALMSIGDSDEKMLLNPDNNHVTRYPWDMCPYVTLSSKERMTVYVKVEPYAIKGE